MARIFLCAWLFLYGYQSAAAMEPFVKVRFDQGHYKVKFNTHIKAPPQRVFQLLVDFNHLHRLSNSIRSSKLIKVYQDGRTRVLVQMRGCFLFFCRHAMKVEDVTIKGNSDIIMVIVPELSDFKYGRARWRLIPHVDGTHLIYTADLVPRFRGRFFIKRQLRKSAMETVERLERMVNQGNDKNGE